MSDTSGAPDIGVSRREFLETTAATLAVASTVPVSGQPEAPQPSLTPDPQVPCTVIQVTVNGVAHRTTVEDRWTIAELVRDVLGLTGTKIGCDRGECGACTVHLDGRPVYACSNLAVWANGGRIDTVEGLAPGNRLDPLQQAFMDHDAAQCGFCTSGQLMSAKALLASNPTPSPDQVRAAMVGNLCRCGNYNRYVESVLAVARRGAGASRGGAA